MIRQVPVLGLYRCGNGGNVKVGRALTNTWVVTNLGFRPESELEKNHKSKDKPWVDKQQTEDDSVCREMPIVSGAEFQTHKWRPFLSFHHLTVSHFSL
jgi:hypothetical protein